ncbi:F-box/kelch-repeat protein SKIP25-like [Magnolia sinica]|uniref:F-box/kelch-repeat protein SKIP25-like n=1 Tax=Magnolia sinica TaxID=86752 RepID=UPI00265B5B5E|nr:F-box/kelch-repeat protein SKIP25-like [Magnolia sinica]
MANSTTIGTAAKRSKASSNQSGQGQEQEEEQPLLPGLPDHIAQHCLSNVPAPLLYSVCRSWRRLLYSPSFPPFLSLYALLFSTSPSTPLGFFSFDPLSATWIPVPNPPPNHPPLPHLLLRHPSFISRHLSIQSISISGHLILLAATTHRLLPALSHPFIFHPVSNQWRLGPPIPTPRRWCAAGSVSGAVYVASGVGADYSADVARSAQRWDLKNPRWEKVAPRKDGKFSREAVDAVGLKGKLYMVNVKGNAAKEGAVYNVERDRWEEMPEGLLAGWTGPTAAMDEEVIYVVDEENGVLMEYDPDMDCWKEVIKSKNLRGATQIAAGGGRICAICTGSAGIAVVDVVKRPARIWVVDPPPMTEVIAIHVLPRMSSPES